MKNHLNILLLILSFTLFPCWSNAGVKKFNLTSDSINNLLNNEVRDTFSYSGLAASYNGLTAYTINGDIVKKLDNNNYYTLNSEQYLVVIGHYRILIAKNINALVIFKNNELIWQKINNTEPEDDIRKIQVEVVSKSDLSDLGHPYHTIRYRHLWEPFRLLCIGAEAFLLWLNSLHGLGWGITIILLSLMFKIFTFPTSILLTLSQRKVSYIREKLAPELERIKTKFSGEEAHTKFIDAHKAQGISIFYSLKPLVLILIPIPIFIVIFNVLGESDLLAGQSFLWIKNLAYPDAVFVLGFSVPFFGDSINFLPILLLFVNIFVAILYQNKIVNTKELWRQKVNLCGLAFLFFFLLYPFPSSIVLFWCCVNIWQLVQQRFVRI